jgi:hypothetical protein
LVLQSESLFSERGNSAKIAKNNVAETAFKSLWPLEYQKWKSIHPLSITDIPQPKNKKSKPEFRLIPQKRDTYDCETKTGILLNLNEF